MQVSIQTVHWSCTNSHMGFQEQCMKAFTSCSPGPSHTSNGVMQHWNNRKFGCILKDYWTISKWWTSPPNPKGCLEHHKHSSEHPETPTQWIHHPDEHVHTWQKLKISGPKATTGTNQSTTQPIGPRNFKTEDQGKSSIISVKNQDILLIIVHRNHWLKDYGQDSQCNHGASKDLAMPDK